MNSAKDNPSEDPQAALADYLDEMLGGSAIHPRRPGASQPVRQAPARKSREPARPLQWDEPPPRVLMPPIAPLPEPQPEAESKSAPKSDPKPRLERRQTVEAEVVRAAPIADSDEVRPAAATISAQSPQPDVQKESGRPAWAGEAFECLIFKVAGLQLAVPLVLLGAIHRLDGELTEIPGRPNWFMGLLPLAERNVRVVDTAAWVMAGRYPEGAIDNYRLVIRLDDSDWGLACDEVAQSFTLDPQDVKWRQTGGKRPWLAGTVIKHMCALLDVGSMAQLLARAEREHQLDLG